MKTHLFVLSLLALSAVVIWRAQAQDVGSQLLAAVGRLKQQQAEITDNEAKLDQKIVDVSETIRVARIFMSRAGGNHKPPPPPKPK